MRGADRLTWEPKPEVMDSLVTYLRRREAGLPVIDKAVALSVSGVYQKSDGYLTDRMAQRGIANAPYIYLAVVAAALLVAGVGVFALRAGPAVSLAFLALFHLVLPYTGIVAAELHLAAPRHLRAQAIAAVTAVYTLLGMVAGPTSVAFGTDRVFANPNQLAAALAIATAVYCPLILLLLFWSRRAASAAIAGAARREW